MRTVHHLLPIHFQPAGHVVFVGGSVRRFQFRCKLVWRWPVRRQRHPKKMLSPQWVLSVHLPEFGNVFSPYPQVLLWGASQLLCLLSWWVALVWSLIATHVHKRSRAAVELISFERIIRLICYLSEKLLVLLSPKDSEPTQEKPCELLKVLSNFCLFWVAQGEYFLTERQRHSSEFFALICFYLSGLSSIIRAYPSLLKLESVIKTSYFPSRSCFGKKSQASLSALLTESKVSLSSQFMLIGVSASNRL